MKFFPQFKESNQKEPYQPQLSDKKTMVFFKKHWVPLVFISTFLLLYFTNYIPGKYLAGWDSVQTELNPLLGIKRAIFSVWEEYQSFGLTAGMAHAADLPRAFVIFILSFILPNHMVRYTFHMSMVLVGMFGMYKLLMLSTNKNKLLSLLGALFYIFNFNVIQMMFLPYESFSLFFGLLPWEIWSFLKLFEDKHFLKWIYFIGINIIGSSQNQATQLFVVYCAILFLLTMGFFIQNKSTAFLKKALLAIFTILIINSYWLLPQIYFLATSGSVVQNAKINQLATEDVLLSNKEKGTINDFITYTGFFYDRLDKTQQPLFQAWKDYRANSIVVIIIYIISFFSVLGIVKKTPYRIPFLLIYFLIAIALLSNTFPFSIFNTVLRSNSFINQIFRSPFTKFSIPYAIVACYFFVFGVQLVLEKIQHIAKNSKHSKRVNTAFICILFLLLIGQTMPAFTGNYISKEMKVTIPKDYFSAIDYFKTIDKNKRIALLPEYTFWDWFYHTWGYNGSGFLWYGVEQPIVSRTFDVWSTTSEGYFWEAKTALQNEDIITFEKVLDKYNIDYLFYDKSLTPLISTSKAIQYDRIDAMLGKSTKIKLKKRWGFISIYEVLHTKKVENFVSVQSPLPEFGPKITTTNTDTAYNQYGDYKVDENQKPTLYYPFLDLTSQKRLTNKKWQIYETNSSWYITTPVPFSDKGYTISTQSGNFDINLYTQKTAVQFVLPYNASFNNSKVSVEFPKVLLTSFKPQDAHFQACGKNTGIINVEKSSSDLTVTTQNGALACFGFEDGHLEQRYGYLIKIRNINETGERLYFFILDKTKEQAYLEDRLQNETEYYILGSRFQYGLGYSFDFQSNSYIGIPSKNTISEASVYLMPYESIRQLSLFSPDASMPLEAHSIDSFQAKKYNYYTYLVTLQNTPQNIHIILHQSYHPGWIAYKVSSDTPLNLLFPFFFGRRLSPHILVNNWENGWVLNSSDQAPQKIVILYLPQYLEYLGFILLGVILFYTCNLWFRKKHLK